MTDRVTFIERVHAAVLDGRPDAPLDDVLGHVIGLVELAFPDDAPVRAADAMPAPKPFRIEIKEADGEALKTELRSIGAEAENAIERQGLTPEQTLGTVAPSRMVGADRGEETEPPPSNEAAEPPPRDALGQRQARRAAALAPGREEDIGGDRGALRHDSRRDRSADRNHEEAGPLGSRRDRPRSDPPDRRRVELG